MLSAADMQKADDDFRKHCCTSGAHVPVVQWTFEDLFPGIELMSGSLKAGTRRRKAQMLSLTSDLQLFMAGIREIRVVKY